MLNKGTPHKKKGFLSGFAQITSPKKFGQVPPTPFSGNARKKSFFFCELFPNSFAESFLVVLFCSRERRIWGRPSQPLFLRLDGHFSSQTQHHSYCSTLVLDKSMQLKVASTLKTCWAVLTLPTPSMFLLGLHKMPLIIVFNQLVFDLLSSTLVLQPYPWFWETRRAFLEESPTDSC